MRSTKRIYLVSQWFPPEHAPIGHMMLELGMALADAGWQVTVVTGFPNHPSGAVYDGYRKRWFAEEYIGKLRVWRCYLATSVRRTSVNRILTFLSFTASAGWQLIWRGRPDVIFAVFQPLTIGIVLSFVASLKRCRLVLNLQDIHPDALIELGLIKNTIFIKVLRYLERIGYQSADALTVICERFREHCVKRGISRERIAVIENWIDASALRPGARMNEFRVALGCSEDDCIVLYAGTLSLVSGAQIVVAAADACRDRSRIKFAVVGDGPLLTELRLEVAKRGLDNVHFMPFQPRQSLCAVQAAADISVVSMRAGTGVNSVPSKVLAYMAAARPVVASVEKSSAIAQLIEQAQCGVVTTAGDAHAMSQAIVSLCESPRLRTQFGMNGRDYLEKRLDKPVVTARYISFFESLMAA